jgi:hypothetical protein
MVDESVVGDCNAIVTWENIFIPVIGNENLREIVDYYGVRLVNCVTSRK